MVKRLTMGWLTVWAPISKQSLAAAPSSGQVNHAADCIHHDVGKLACKDRLRQATGDCPENDTNHQRRTENTAGKSETQAQCGHCKLCQEDDYKLSITVYAPAQGVMDYGFPGAENLRNPDGNSPQKRSRDSRFGEIGNH